MSGNDFTQRLGLTTFNLILLSLGMFYTRSVSRPKTYEGKFFEFLLFIFALFISISQFINHNIF
ncbi:MAG: hypothetical protein WCK03_03985, partial [Candidatus Taylorbacteria bacterium]